MGIAAIRAVVVKVYDDVWKTRMTAVAAGVAFFLLMSLIPLLITGATLLGFLPVPHLFDRGMEMLAHIVPADAYSLVRSILKDLMVQRQGLLSAGIIGTVWVASGGFSAMIDALDIAYDVEKSRSLFRQRLLAVWLAFVVGGLFTVGLTASILGPRFGIWLSVQLHLRGPLAHFWPLIRWGAMVSSVVAAVELLYYWGPNVKQRFWATLPGALIATAVWLGASMLLGLYISHFGHYNKTYGSLGAVIALMLWLWVTCMILLAGAELNSELQKHRGAPLEGQAVDDNPQHMGRPSKAA